ncbi:Ig-like domain-containing protein [Phenylobacterium sp.]|uniref:Ig-like domain-containing protein n=1 Tax=Phenylobacterium sp. TaxID=1871053 RepID=UPI0035B2C0B1
MSDAAIQQTYEASVTSPLASAAYTGAAALLETGPAVDLSVYKEGQVTLSGCGGETGLSFSTATALTLQIVRTGDQVTVAFDLSTTLEAAMPLAGGEVNTFSAALAITGSFSFRYAPASSCYDVKTYCGEVLKSCGSGGQLPVAGKPGFAIDASTSLWFGDAGETGTGALMLEKGKVSVFSGGAEGDGDSAQAATGTAVGALALGMALSGERRSGDPMQGFSQEDVSLLKAIGLAAGAMSADESEGQALKTTLGLTYAGVGLAADYAEKALAMAAVAPTELALAARTDGGVKGDGLTNVRQVQIDGVTGAYAQVKLYDGAKLVAQGQADRSGAFHLTTSALSDGDHSLTAVATDASGVSVRSDALAVAVDAQGPAAPVIGAVTLQGLSGVAEAGARVTVYDGYRTVGVTEAGADGRWSLDNAITDTAAHSFTAAAADAAGNTASSAGAALITRAQFGKLVGGSGADVLVAGPDDVLTGGAGRDLFVFDFGAGKATVTDFRAGADQIRIDDALADSFADVKAHAAQKGYDVVITLDADHVLTLKSVSLSSLSAGDFLFG